MSDIREVMKQALEALDCLEAPPTGAINHYELERRKNALRAVLAQPDVPDEQARDAKRYRWLRHALSDNGPNGKSHWFCSISAGHPEELDSALDAAMKGGEA